MRNEWSNFIGAWAVLPDWLALHQGQIEAFMDGSLVRKSNEEHQAISFGPEDLIQRGDKGLAQIAIHGPMIKHAGFWETLFGYVGTDMVRAAVDHAANAEDISSIMLHIESPGGHVAGVHELAQSVRAANQKKPVAAYIEDIGASAAYWVASGARLITASPTAEVGSLGTLAVIADLSAMAAQTGIKVHVISTGKFKGMGTPGTEVEDEHLAEIQRRVNDVNAFFMAAVRQGRQMNAEALGQVNDGRVWIADRAKNLGLIDGVGTYEQAIKGLGRESGGDRVRRKVLAELAVMSERFRQKEIINAC